MAEEGLGGEEGTAVPIQVSVRYETRDPSAYVAVLVECPECLGSVRKAVLREHIERCKR